MEPFIETDRGRVVHLKPTEQAGSRTKNRLREHGRFFFLLDWGFPQSFDGDAAICVEPTNQGDSWLGWLPLNEVELTWTSWTAKFND